MAEQLKQDTRRRRWARWGGLLVSTMSALILAELIVRGMGTTDADGHFYFRGRLIGPSRPPVSQIRRTLQQYRASKSSRMIYDPLTGWKPRPDSSSHEGMYRYNAHGIRSVPTEYSLAPPSGVVRIALFGDSFTHGDDVPFEETWGHILELDLRAAGMRAEVINFGVSAYGMDQAFLRWRTLGRRFAPHIVLFGFQAENVGRNVNIFRALYAPGTGIPFTKPRFVLDDTGRLTLVNSPTLPLDEIPQVLGHLQNSELAKYEWFYNPEAPRRRFWHTSRFLSLAMEVATSEGPNTLRRTGDLFARNGEPVRVTLRLLEAFRREVQRTGADFYLVHLPKEDDVSRRLSDRPLPYRELFDQLSQEYPMIDPLPELLQAVRQTSLDKLVPRHYSAAGNRIIADIIAEALLRQRNRTREEG